MSRFIIFVQKEQIPAPVKEACAINILLHLQCTVTKTSLVAGFPTLLFAVHLKYPWSCLLMTRGKVTTLLSDTLVQVMFGFGFPTAASQVRVTLSPSVTVWLGDIFVMAGGTEKKDETALNIPVTDFTTRNTYTVGRCDTCTSGHLRQ